MGVRVDKSGQEGTAVEFDYFGLRASQVGDLLIGTDGNDSISGDGDGFGDTVLGVYGDYFAAAHDQIGVWRLLRREKRNQQQPTREQPHAIPQAWAWRVD
jgi:hypothetical protein